MYLRLLLILILLPSFGFSQIQRKFSSYTADDGLNQNSIYDIIQDHKGNLWFSTANGISRSDGNDIYNYKYDPNDSTSIYGEFYFVFYEDNKKQLWIGHDKGLSYYDRIKNQFVNIFKDTNFKPYTVYNILTEDNSEKIWVLTSNTTLLSFDINNKTIIDSIKLDDLKSNAAIIKKPIFHNNIIIFQNEWHHLISFNTKTLEINKLPLNNQTRIEFERLNENSYISFNLLNSIALIITINGDKITQKEIKLNIKGNSTSSCIAYSKGKFYVGTLNGLYIINKYNFDDYEYIEDFGQYNQSSMFMEYIYVDKSDNIILGTNGMGVRILSPHMNKFLHIGSNQEKLNMTKSIVTTSDGKIIVGLHAVGFIIIDRKKYTYKHIFLKPETESDISHSHVYSIINWSKDEILLTYSNRLLIYNHVENKVIKKQKKYFNTIQSQPQLKKYKNNFYLNVTEKEISYIAKVKKDLSIDKVFATKTTTISCYQFLNDSILVIGTINSFILYNYNTKKIINKQNCPYVKSILLTSKNEIYFSTIRGFFKINLQGKIIERYDENSGMANDNIYGLLEDNNGNFWFSHNKGLSIYYPKNKKITNYNILDGLQSNEFNTGSYHKGSDGLIYFGGVNGINIIDPNNIHYNPYPPQVSLNKIYLFDEEFKTDTFYNELNVLNLDYTQNTLAFDFSALDFSNPSANKYKYILEGYDNTIIESGNRHYARYANLPPGNYILKLYGSNNDGIWSTQPKIIRINIIPPYWQTTWFYWLSGFAILLCIIGVIYYFIYRQKLTLKRKLKLQYELEQERLRIARDLHDNVGAHLSYLISNLDWMISHPQKLSEEEEKKRLENLTEAGRQAILTLRQTIWAINNQALYIEDFADKFKSFANKMLEFSGNIHITFEEQFTKKQQLSPGVTLHLFRICQESLSNILKHAQAKNISILFRSDEEYLFYYKIIDDGVGFDTSTDYTNEHYGLAIMAERAKECGAQLKINSSPNQGTTIELLLPHTLN